MLITRTDPLTGKTNSLDLPVTPEQFQKWKGGDLIQDAFWNLDSAQREFIKSGLIPESWDKLFKEKPESSLPVPEEWASFGEIAIGSSRPCYRLTSDDDGHDYIIPSDKLSEWHEYLKAFYKASDAYEETPDEPEWAVQINGSSCITFDNWKED